MQEKKLNIVFLSTYPPRECGLATFTQDLMEAIDAVGTVNSYVIAVNNSISREYGDKVIHEINQYNQLDYTDLARKLNNSDMDLLVIEHEFGIYGGEYGEYIMGLLKNVNIPVITTLHTVLKRPNPKQKKIIRELGERSTKLVTMAQNTKEILEKVYKISPDKIEVIHHGVPIWDELDRQSLKNEMGYGKKILISTFGLLSPGKGIEYAISAIAKTVEETSNILYLILGKTHPDQKDESYREMLEGLVTKYNIENNVKFINKYLTKEEIIRYLQMSDIYMTPYLSREQAVSGTLAYAVGYGRAIVSTPYLYAKEMLADKRGMLAEFENADSLYKCLDFIIKNPDEKADMEKRTLTLGKTMFWPIVAQCYIDLFTREDQLNQEASLIVFPQLMVNIENGVVEC